MAKLTFINDAKTVEAKPGDKLIDICGREELSVPFGCQNGICGTCLSKIKKGMENLNKVSEHERNTLDVFTDDKEHRLICQCVLEKDGDVDIEN